LEAGDRRGVFREEVASGGYEEVASDEWRVARVGKKERKKESRSLTPPKARGFGMTNAGKIGDVRLYDSGGAL
jgi:hypothetical protein